MKKKFARNVGNYSIKNKICSAKLKSTPHQLIDLNKANNLKFVGFFFIILIISTL